MARLRMLEEAHQFWNKSMYDYNYLLKNRLDTGAQYRMPLQDDVFMKEGLYPQALLALKDIQVRMKKREWLYLRLFYTEKLFGWTSEEWLQYLGWSILAFLVTATTVITARSHSRRLRKHLSKATIAILCFFYLPATILLYFMASWVSVQPPPSQDYTEWKSLAAVLRVLFSLGTLHQEPSTRSAMPPTSAIMLI